MKSMNRSSAKFVVGILVFLLAATSIVAEGAQETTEDYPSRPIEIVVPYGAGGGTDTIARILQEGMQERMPVPVTIRNIGGGGGSIGSAEVFSAKPDGYTLLFNQNNIWTSKAMGTVDFGASDFTPIAQFGSIYLTFAAQANSEFENLAEVRNALQKNPESVSLTTNIGTVIHFVSLMLEQEMGAPFQIVHIGDGAVRTSELLGGHIDIAIFGSQASFPYYQAGEMKILGITSEERVDDYPDVPTLLEQEIDLSWSNDHWLFAPPETPEDRAQYLAEVIADVFDDEAIRARLRAQGVYPTYKAGTDLEQHLDRVGKTIMKLADDYDL